MKIKLLILVLFLSQNIFSQKQKDKYIYSHGLQYFFIEKGKWVRYFQGDEGDKSRVREITNFKKDKRNGKFTMFFPNGKIDVEGYYLNDEEHGEIKSYDKKGALSIVRNVVNGKTIESKHFFLDKVSTHIKINLETNEVLTKKYDSYGNLVKTTSKKGEIESVKLFNKSGFLINEFTLHQNRRIGKDIKYDKNGITSIEEYLEDKTRYYIKYYSKDNSILITGKYNESGGKEGPWTHYSKDGTIHHITNYQKSKKNGIHKSFKSNGKLSFKGNYKDGKKDGEWIYYSKLDDSIEETINYNNGVKE